MLSLKQIGTICLTIFLSVSFCFASGVSPTATTADCDNATLSTYSGTTNLQADWEQNTINLHWYNGNTELTVPAESQSCVYDGGLTLPATTPTRIGYTFTGWHARPTYDFSTFTVRYGIEARGKNENGACYLGRVNVDSGSKYVTCDNTFGDLTPGEWKNSFSYGTIYGMTMCSSTVGTTRGEIGTPVEATNGAYCWCKVTGYVPSESNIKYAPSNTLPWVYCVERSYCELVCADWCAWTFIHIQSNMQSPAFGK